MDLTTLLTLLGFFVAICALIIGVFLYLASKIDSLQASIYVEMKDFHGRLCAIEKQRKN